MGRGDVLRAKVRSVLAAGMTPDEAADAVARLLHVQGEDIIETETTTLADARRQVVWSRVLVCWLPLESGHYEGGPVCG